MRLLLLLLLFLLPPPLPGQTNPPVQYVGSQVCRSCHADIWSDFFKNPHFKSIATGREPPERTGCEGCHGPGQAHVQAFGAIAAIRAFSVMQPGEAIEACLDCHEENLSQSNIRRSSHTLADVACTGCHSIHGSPPRKDLLAKTERDVCYDCHPAVRSQFSMPSKHRVNEGFMRCSDCHNPHGAPAPTWRMGLQPRMVAQRPAGDPPCLKCHSDKRGPFVFEHPSVRVDGCESCHTPHGSVNPRLLRRPVVFTLCLECHNAAGDFGRRGDGIAPQSATHNMADPRYQNCTACHVRIHGSNTDPRFLR